MTRRTRLFVTALEARDTPSGPGDALAVAPIVTGPIAVIGGGAKVLVNAPPVISDFRAVVGPNGQVSFTGRVTDDTPVAGYVVRITGPGVDATAIVGSDGTFRVTTFVTGSADVTVSATTTDASGARSDPAYTTFHPSN
jgi:hypothetical protein